MFMGIRGPKQSVDPGTLYSLAHQLYWDFRRLDEGGYRWRIDEEEEKQLIVELDNVQLSDEQKLSLQRNADEEIRAGRLREEEKEEWLRQAEAGQLSATREWLRRQAAEKATKKLKIPGQPGLIDALLQLEDPTKMQRFCEDSPNWPILSGSVLPYYLSRHAQEFNATKKDRRFPRSARPSNRLKQLWFLSRALAGAVFGVKTRTAVNLVGAKRPEETFEASRAAKSARKKRRQK